MAPGPFPTILAGTSLSVAANALHPGTITSEFLSESLQRQSRHIAYELNRLKEDRFGSESEEVGIGPVAVASHSLDHYFAQLIQGGLPEDELATEAALAESTLRELRTLHGVDHFFTIPMQQFFKTLTLLSPEYELFGAALFRELQNYCSRRDDAESQFLRPFHDYRDQLMAIVGSVQVGSSFGYFEMEERIKRNLLAKLRTREWRDMSAFYDLVGLRLLVGNQREVVAAEALVQGALKLHEAHATLSPTIPHFFRVDHVEIKDNERGYRARHVNVRRYSRDDDRHHPTAEIQIMSLGIRRWGEIQRLLVYKEDRIPPAVRAAINDYCRAGASCLIACEEGQRIDRLPDIDIALLDDIPDLALRSDVLDRLCDMEKLICSNAGF